MLTLPGQLCNGSGRRVVDATEMNSNHPEVGTRFDHSTQRD